MVSWLTLVDQSEPVVEPYREEEGRTYYTFEYTIKTATWYRHNMAVFAEFGGKLYTMVAQVPQTEWPKREASFRAVADSFRLFVPTG